MFPHIHRYSIYLHGILLVFPGALLAQDRSSQSQVKSRKVASQPQQAHLALLKGRRWLEQQQARHGSWQSRTYAGFEGKVATSALVMSALVEVTPATADQELTIRPGLAFLNSKFSQKPLWKSVEAESNYPLYSVSLMLMTLNQIQSDTTAAQLLRDSLSQELLRQQTIIQPDRVSAGAVAGGWKPGSELFSQRSAVSPANVSVTYHALEALSGARRLPLQNRNAALDYLQHIQIPTGAAGAGGFVFTLMPDHPLNKAGSKRNQAGQQYGVPYLSATCDGISAMLACDVTSDDQRIQSALAALPHLSHSRLAEITLNTEGSYQKLDALYFYEAAATARVWQQMRNREVPNQFLNSRRHQILQTLIETQHADGHWENPLPWMMEDDPLIATTFALQALHRCRTPIDSK
ncbi:MAG TPA: hypothetical protein DDZ90_14385 [Planctomycetaceae bacterium]|nr:hypothetical protein [Planctomycetaceae bacterium]